MTFLQQKIKKILLYIQKRSHIDVIYIAKGGFWTTFGFVISSILSLLLVTAFATFLSKESYGTYKYIMSIAGSLGFLTLTGMNTAVQQAVANGQRGVLKYAVKIQLRWNLIFSLGIGIAGSYYLIQGDHLFAFGLFILGATFPFVAVYNTYGAFLGGIKEFKWGSIYGIASSIIYLLAMLLTVYITQNLLVIIAVYGLSNLIPNIFIYYYIIYKYKLKNSTKEEEKKLFSYAGHLSIMNIFSTLSQYVDKIVVFHFLGAIQLAVYSLSLVMPEKIRGFSKNINSLLFPKLTEKTIKDIRSVFFIRTIQFMLIGLIMSLVYIILSPFVFRIFLPKYLDSILYSQVFSLNLIFSMPANYMSSVFKSKKMLRAIYLSSVVAHISRIVLFIILGMLFGIWGVITAALAIYALGTIYNLILWNNESDRLSTIGYNMDPNPLTE